MFIRPVLAGLVAASVLLGTGCSSDKPRSALTSPPLAPSSAAAATSLTPNDAAGSNALSAYRQMWSAFVEAGKSSDPEAPDLPKYASDQALRLIVSSLYTDRDRRRVSKGELKIDPKVTALTPADAPTEATIVDCVNDEKWLKYKASGGLVNDVPGGRHRTTAMVKRTPDGWKVASFILKEGGTC